MIDRLLYIAVAWLLIARRRRYLRGNLDSVWITHVITHAKVQEEEVLDLYLAEVVLIAVLVIYL